MMSRALALAAGLGAILLGIGGSASAFEPGGSPDAQTNVPTASDRRIDADRPALVRDAGSAREGMTSDDSDAARRLSHRR